MRNSLLASSSALFIALSSVASAAIDVCEHPDMTGVNKYYGGNRAPLQSSPMERLPLGSVKADGWLQHQLTLMADGQVGRLEELSKFLKDDNGWFGGDERGWEEAPYWFRGFYDLSILTGNERLLKSRDKWIEALVSSQAKDGYYGSDFNRLVKGSKKDQAIADLWPHMAMNDALISHYEATGDERIIPMMTKFFAFCRDLPDQHFLPQISWDYYENYKEEFGDWKPRTQLKRAGDFVPQILWVYNKTGEEWLLDLAVKVYHRTQPAMNEWLDNHNVNFAQRVRYAAQMYPITGDKRYIGKSDLFLKSFELAWGQMPRGAFASDERIRSGKIDARQAIETCGICELNKSYYIMSRITGDTAYADKVEDLTFNALPASHAPDHRSIRYLTACNMVYSEPKMDFKNKNAEPMFSATNHRCCQHNTAMGWPWFVRNLWQASPDNGLVAWLYAPNTVSAKVGAAGSPVTIASDTVYPFGDRVVMNISAEQSAAFPLYLRVPGWCDEMEIKVPGENQTITEKAGKLMRIDRTWADGDKVEIRFGMDLKATTWPRNGAVTVDRGPLSYSVRIKENWNKVSGKGKAAWPRFTLSPASDWNYGLAIDAENPAADIKITKAAALADQPWSEANAPIVLRVPAKKIEGWKSSRRHTVDAVREGPVKSDAPLETIEMIPMGCAHLRMTVLPLISDRKDARYWEDIPNPDEFMTSEMGQ